MKTFATTVLLGALLCAAASAFSWHSTCSGTATISEVDMSPNPPVAGQNLTIVLSGSLSSAITSATIVLNVTLNVGGSWIPVPGSPYSLDLCSVEPSACPQNAGPINLKGSAPLPIITPPGDYAGSIVMTDQTGANVACVDFQTSISPP